MKFISINSMVICTFIYISFIFKLINCQEGLRISPGTAKSLNSDYDYEYLTQGTSVKPVNDLSFIRNSSHFTTDIPKPWINKLDMENRKSEEWADPPLPLNRVRVISTKTNISKYLLSNCGESHATVSRIVGGANTQEGTYPWVVLILNKGDPWCAGSILNQEWVLTAAHCFMLDANPAIYSIRVGSVNRHKGSNYKISKVIMHQRFHINNMFNSDIALLKISTKITLDKNVGGICLPTKTLEETTTKEFTVVGWGQLSYAAKNIFPDILQHVTLNNVDPIECSKRYRVRHTVIYRSQFCLWNRGQDACQGDSGSAMMEMRDSKMYQVGIVSYGFTCADEYPGVFTKISYFLIWIIKTIEDNK